MSWFQPHSMEPLYKFELLGILVSLAIYNGLTLPFNFPVALYAKLLHWRLSEIVHIEDGWPALAKGLAELLSWEDGDVEDVFVRSYEFSVETPGSTFSSNMEPDGPAVPAQKAEESAKEPRMVTNENRKQYVQDYIAWLTDKSIRPQYEAFEEGFYCCLDRQAMNLFTPVMLKHLVEGTQDVNVEALQKTSHYDGYSAQDKAIKDFWHVVYSFSPEQVRKLLEFVTASDRVPFGGVGTIDFTIQKNGSGDDGVSHDIAIL